MKVFLCEHIHPDARRKLEAHGEIIDDWKRISECYALINRNLQITAQVMAELKSMKVIAIHGTGTDGVDLEEAARRGIKVVYAPHRNAVSVAEHIAGLILSAARKIVYARRLIDAGETDVLSPLCGMELRGKTLGLIGMGGIAKELAKIFRDGFGMRIVATSPSLTPQRAEALGVDYGPDLAAVVRQADVVNISVPLNAQTRDMINAEVFSLMKPGAIFVNASRGAVVDEAALYNALHSGRLFAAASDVFASEPAPPDHPLLSLPNFVATPHIASNTEDALRRLGFDCVDQILMVMAGEMPPFPLVGFSG
jgi:D-3-phosphoglycerate dehydrogenase